MLYNTRYPDSFFHFLYSLPSDPLLFLRLLLSLTNPCNLSQGATLSCLLSCFSRV